MKKVTFNLKDAPNLFLEMEIDFQPVEVGNYTVREEQLLALLIYNHFPALKECHRRIKSISVKDEDGNVYENNDFDIYGFTTKKEKK